jgi:ABC-type uncharacterized transport system ATPase component
MANAMPVASVAPRRLPPAVIDSECAGDCLVRIAGLEKIYKTRDGNDIHALKDIDLDIHTAEFLSVVGPSGCGKTTLLKILAGSCVAPPVRSVAGRGSGPSTELGIVFSRCAAVAHLLQNAVRSKCNGVAGPCLKRGQGH